jgi:hypothetical protein
MCNSASWGNDNSLNRDNCKNVTITVDDTANPWPTACERMVAARATRRTSTSVASRISHDDLAVPSADLRPRGGPAISGTFATTAVAQF